jgi:hypothetical protein
MTTTPKAHYKCESLINFILQLFKIVGVCFLLSGLYLYVHKECSLTTALVASLSVLVIDLCAIRTNCDEVQMHTILGNAQSLYNNQCDASFTNLQVGCVIMMVALVAEYLNNIRTFKNKFDPETFVELRDVSVRTTD